MMIIPKFKKVVAAPPPPQHKISTKIYAIIKLFQYLISKLLAGAKRTALQVGWSQEEEQEEQEGEQEADNSLNF